MIKGILKTLMIVCYMLIVEANCYNLEYKNAILCFYVSENMKSKDNNSKFRLKCINQENWVLCCGGYESCIYCDLQ